MQQPFCDSHSVNGDELTINFYRKGQISTP